ncbi:MAG TPA: hypothetical protein VK530_14995 [Candidatus Acidoferrum sp.]|nr:hypothetical protein [Candidatus Acidoferrum sp.]
MSEIWNLPGPLKFLRAVAEDLRSGVNVTMVFPDHAPDGWITHLRIMLLDSLPRLDHVACDGKPPIQLLHHHLGLGEPSQRATVADLCNCKNFSGRLLYVSFTSSEPWKAWRSFLEQYEDACRHFSLSERTLFIASISGDLAEHAPKPANLLRVYDWTDRVDGLDVRLHAANLLSSVSLPAWQRNLAVSLLAELALWDPIVCAEGASRSLEELVEPVSWLADIARSRNWPEKLDLKSPQALRHGIRQPFEGIQRIHSAWLALASRHDTLEERVWNAQVRALFPILERHRRALIKKYGSMHLFKVPWITRIARIEHIEDLELNHMADQMRSQNSAGLRSICDFVSWLRDLRNDLAHLKPIPASRLLDPRFTDRMSHFLSVDDL